MGDPQGLRSAKSGGRQAASGKGSVGKWKSEVEKRWRVLEMGKWFKYYSASELVTRLLRYVKISVGRDPIQTTGEEQRSRVRSNWIGWLQG